MRYQFSVPMEAPSTSNMREHWAKRATRVKKQREATTLAMGRWDTSLPEVVTLTRVAPRALDDDNLRGALKAFRDAVAARLGIDDRDPRVRWEYAQEKTARGALAEVRVVLSAGNRPP